MAAAKPSSLVGSGDVESEIIRFFKQTGKVIGPLTVQELPHASVAVSLRSALDEQIAHKLA